MDDEAVRRAGQVAAATSAWLQEPTDTAAYHRFVVATDDWDDYGAPHLEEPTEELLDHLADESAPRALGEVVADVSAQIRKAERRRH